MTATSVRYMREKGQIELALQMIAYEARTHTIRGCTGLSDDRIRRLYSTYFKGGNGITVKRQRGKSPKRIDTYTSSLERQRHAATLASLLVQFNLVNHPSNQSLNYDHKGIAYGTRFCRAYALYRAICNTPKFCFERAWSLCEALNEAIELRIEMCLECHGIFVHDCLSLQNQVCSCCRIKSN